MERVEGKVIIEAPRAKVMEVLADFSTYPTWSGFSSCEILTKDDSGRATQVAIVLAMGPINAKYTIEIDYVPDVGGLRWKFVEGSGITDTEGEYLLEDEGDGTLVRYSGAADANLPMPGFMKRKLIAEGQKIGRDRALKGLKGYVEALA